LAKYIGQNLDSLVWNWQEKIEKIPQEALTHLKNDVSQWCGPIAWDVRLTDVKQWCLCMLILH